jgi:hypothetical protein
MTLSPIHCTLSRLELCIGQGLIETLYPRLIDHRVWMDRSGKRYSNDKQYISKELWHLIICRKSFSLIGVNPYSPVPCTTGSFEEIGIRKIVPRGRWRC